MDSSDKNALKMVTIHTDGAFIGNPGPGGYGTILRFQDNVRELSAGYRKTTNNRMELMAAIVGLQRLKERCLVTIYSDSAYVVNGISKGWALDWRKNGWKLKDKGRASNIDLWQALLDACAQHDVEFVWLKGHAGNVDNERCDFLATDAAANASNQVDEAYELSLGALQ